MWVNLCIYEHSYTCIHECIHVHTTEAIGIARAIGIATERSVSLERSKSLYPPSLSSAPFSPLSPPLSLLSPPLSSPTFSPLSLSLFLSFLFPLPLTFSPSLSLSLSLSLVSFLSGFPSRGLVEMSTGQTAEHGRCLSRVWLMTVDMVWFRSR